MSEKKYVKRIGWVVETKFIGRTWFTAKWSKGDTKTEAIYAYNVIASGYHSYGNLKRRGLARLAAVYVEVSNG